MTQTSAAHLSPTELGCFSDHDGQRRGLINAVTDLIKRLRSDDLISFVVVQSEGNLST